MRQEKGREVIISEPKTLCRILYDVTKPRRLQHLQVLLGSTK